MKSLKKEEMFSEGDRLLNVVTKKGSYYVCSAEGKNTLWNVVKNFGIEDGEPITEGMAIRFGCSRYQGYL